MELVLVSMLATAAMLALELFDMTRHERALQHAMAGVPLRSAAKTGATPPPAAGAA